MEISKINILEKLELFSDYWNPRIIGELNGQSVKLAKLKGEFVWHTHDAQDELFLIIQGNLRIDFRDRSVDLSQGEMIIIPRGIEHKPYAREETSVMLFEPIETINTGNEKNSFTKINLQKI